MFNEIFIDYLIDCGVISSEIGDSFLRKCDENNSFIVDELLKDGLLGNDVVYTYFSSFINVELLDLQLSEIDLNLVNKYSRDKITSLRCLPLYEKDSNLYVAFDNIFKFENIYEFIHVGKMPVIAKLITSTKMDAVIEFINNKARQNEVLSNYSDSDSDITNKKTVGVDGDSDAPIIILCDSILRDAISRGASDIHIEPFKEEILVRYRIDGKLQVLNRLKIHMFQPLLARFKIMADLNIAERRVPQDGKISKEINGASYDFRVSTMPTIHGEKIVIRIYNKTLNTNNLSLLGLSDMQKDSVISFITRPHGIILLTGPTGSGKSTSLYAFLRYLNHEDTNIITIEDPVENEIDGIIQVQVNPKANLSFSSVLRAILRQDPNIIMIGEIRDEETAEIAVRAAITGHLVLSTIHTNSAAGVVSRLIDMGVAPYLVADSLLCSISQRLVRKLCPNCKREHITTNAEMGILGINEPRKIYEPVGCPVCSHTGYRGRAGIFEILPVDVDTRSVIMSDHFTSELLANSVKDKVPTIIDDAKKKVLSGITSIEEYEGLIEEIHNNEKDIIIPPNDITDEQSFI